MGADYDALRCWFFAPTLPSAVGVIIVTFLLTRALPGGPRGYFVNRDPGVVRLLCPRVLVMYLGRIIESGPAARMFAAPA